jgi:hypothetical protein
VWVHLRCDALDYQRECHHIGQKVGVEFVQNGLFVVQICFVLVKEYEVQLMVF